jgi:outer membrane protein TolC
MIEANTLTSGKRLVAVLASAILLLAGFAHGQESLSMDQLVAQVLASNNRAEAARFMEQSAKESVGAAGRWPDPMLMLGIQNSPKDFDFEKDAMTMRVVGLSQDIPYSGFLGLQRKAAGAAARESALDRQVTERDLAYAARLAYIDLYFKQQLLAELLQQKSLLEQIAKSVESQIQTNQANREQLLASQGDIWRLESSILSLQQEIDASTLRLNSLRGLSGNSAVGTLAAPGSNISSDSIDTWFAMAKANYPPLAKLQSRVEKYQFEEKAANRMTFPMLNLRAEYGIRTGREIGLHGDPGEEREDMVSFAATISLLIFSRGGQRAMARSMRAMSLSQSHEAEQLWSDIESALRSLHLRSRRLAESVALYDSKIVPNSSDIYESALSNYAASKTTLSDLLGYQMALIQDQSTLIQLRAEQARAAMEVLQYIEAPFGETSPTVANNQGQNP